MRFCYSVQLGAIRCNSVHFSRYRVLWSTSWAIFVITIKICYNLPKLLLEFMPFDLAWNSTTDVFDQIPHSCHFVLHIAVNTNVSEGFVVTAIWSTYMEGRPADRFVLHIAVKPIIRFTILIYCVTPATIRYKIWMNVIKTL